MKTVGPGAVGLGILLMGIAQQITPALSEYPAATVREEQSIAVDGVAENWRLQWAAVPAPYCEPDAASLTCPCMGFAYGEAGDLFLVRLRNGAEIDRLHLTPLFTEGSGNAIVQRWPADFERDFEASERDNFTALVGRRATVRIMHFGDYDHDGGKTEFYLQTEALPCGKSTGIVIGLSRRNPKLHAFGTVTNPGKPLYMQKRVWEALRDASGMVEVLSWACRDHGADTETRLRLHWTRDGIEGIRREYTCPGKAESRRLIGEKPL